MKSKNCKVLAVTSGKGGVGKSNFCINLSIALSKAGYETYLFDADLALGNADILFGELPDKTIENLIDCGLGEDLSIEEIDLGKIYDCVDNIEKSIKIDRKINESVFYEENKKISGRH